MFYRLIPYAPTMQYVLVCATINEHGKQNTTTTRRITDTCNIAVTLLYRDYRQRSYIRP